MDPLPHPQLLNVSAFEESVLSSGPSVHPKTHFRGFHYDLKIIIFSPDSLPSSRLHTSLLDG